MRDSRWVLMRCPAVSGGFAVVQPDSTLTINAVEAYTLDQFSPEAVKAELAEAQKIAASGGSEQDIAEAKIEIEVGIMISEMDEMLMRIGLGGSPGCFEGIDCVQGIDSQSIQSCTFRVSLV